MHLVLSAVTMTVKKLLLSLKNMLDWKLSRNMNFLETFQVPTALHAFTYHYWLYLSVGKKILLNVIVFATCQWYF